MFVLHVEEVLEVWPESERQRIWVSGTPKYLLTSKQSSTERFEVEVSVNILDQTAR